MGVTLEDIARETGYAKSTVSSVLNGAKSCYASATARGAIEGTARRLGYQPNFFARGLSRQRSGLIGVGGAFFSYEVAGAQFRGIEPVLREQGYLTLLLDTFHEPQRFVDAVAEFRRLNVEGMVLEIRGMPPETWEDLPRDLPCVLIADEEIEGFPTLAVDRCSPVAETVEWLIGLGHRRIAFVCSESRRLRPKRRGYREALRRHGLHDPGLELFCAGDVGATHDSLLADPERLAGVTALLCSNDRVAAEALTAFAALGVRVPEDCSVVGFDDSTIASVIRPRLTTLRQPREEVGRHVTRMLTEVIAGREVGNVVLVPERIQRESTGPPGTSCLEGKPCGAPREEPSP